MRDRPAAALAVQSKTQLLCPVCHQPVVDLDDRCPACEVKRLALARADRRAEFYDVQFSQLTVHLRQEQVHAPWRVFAEFKPKGKVPRLGLQSDFSEDDRATAAQQFGKLVCQAMDAGWKPVVAPWDAKLVNPQQIVDAVVRGIDVDL